MTRYDRLGRTYSVTRRTDPRIATAIARELEGARSVVNVGAGTGSYEPPHTAVAIEPTLTMISQRPAAAAPAVQAVAEHLPLRDNSADAALAVLTIHHFWLMSDYLPAAAQADPGLDIPLDRLTALLGGAVVTPVPIPHDCADGFGAAFWRRPAAYLDPAVQAGISFMRSAPTCCVPAWTGWPPTSPPASGTSSMRSCCNSTNSTSATGS